MDQDFRHEPVMVREVVDLLGPLPPGWVIDATVGGAGHAAAVLDAHPHLSVLGLDRDGDAVGAASARLASYGPRAQVVQARFDCLALEAARIRQEAGSEVVGVLFDLGVSSVQIDRPERGFSYRAAGPLDMRMDPSSGLTAADVVNDYGEAELAELFRDSGETRWASRMARAIVAARPLADTTALAEVVAGAVPAPARRRGHPAARVFQALRIEVNAELEVLSAALDQVPAVLCLSGRCLVLAYHSGEDRLVKDRFRSWSGGACTCPPALPCACGAPRFARLIGRGARQAGADELAANPRASAARLRAVEMVQTPEDQP
ncbi:MAG TPA: 16S rRNA (cytosine(1402)-N(4))-methyltransferase RsmH [Acidimicrobiales bacterium]|nr:16S rRNA (cytosine(1402)-N(4))-methyltransferase RsmH [Acidimicrobiales bacterium]